MDAHSGPGPAPATPPRDLLDQLPDVVYVAEVEPRFRIEYVSDGITELLGWTPSEFYADPGLVRRGLDPRDADQLAQFLSSPAGVPFQVTLRWRTSRGRLLFLQHRVRSRWRADGVLLAYGVLRDVTATKAVEKHLVDTERLYGLLSEHASDVVYQADAAGIVRYVSPSVRQTLGWAPADLIGRRAGDLLAPQQDLDAIDEQRRRLYEGVGDVGDIEGVAEAEMLVLTSSGSPRWMAARGRAVRGDDGQPNGIVVGLRDVHDQVVSRRALAASEQLFRTSMMQNPNGLVLFRRDGSVIAANPAFCTLLQADEATMLAARVSDLAAEEDLAEAHRTFVQVSTGEVESEVGATRMVRADGVVIWTRWGLSLIRDADGEPDYLVGQYQDLTPEHEARERLAFLSEHDGLTGLHNREWILHALSMRLRVARAATSTLGVLHVDLDRFRLVNDSLGTSAGDDLLRVVAERIRGAVPADAIIARTSGDEFIVVLAPSEAAGMDLEAMDEVAAGIQRAIGQEVRLGARRVIPSASVGIAESQPGSTAEGLLRAAALAHHQSKSDGRSRRRVFDAPLAAEAARRLTMEEELRDAIERQEFLAYFQPVVRLSDETVVGFEALVRWNHPHRGIVTPDAFLPVAEQTGLVVPLGEQVLDQVCAALAREPGLPGRVGVNISAMQLGDPGVVSTIVGHLAKHGVDPRRLAVEVTETTVVRQLDLAQAALAELRGLGIGVHMDDFGTGYSSISLLRDLPVTGIKLDRRFVTELTEHDSSANALATGLAGLASGLGLESIAEGIETDEQARLVLAQGWTFGQGYLFGRPAPVEHWIA